MEDTYFSSGQTARELGVTQGKIRTLCETGTIEATSSPGGQWRISKTEVERLKRNGLPPVARPMPEAEPGMFGGSVRSRGSNSALLAAPSGSVIDSAEQVVCLEHEVKSLNLRRQCEESMDWFREREDREAERRAERDEAERERLAQAEAERERQAWEAHWIGHALDSIPSDAPQSVRLDVNEEVEQALDRLDPTRPDSITRQLVCAAADKALLPWRKSKQVEDRFRKPISCKRAND